MSKIPNDLRYTKSHEWVRMANGAAHGAAPNGAVEVGISEHAQSALGDLVFVEVPEAGRVLNVGDACAVVESVKAASDVYSPVSGAALAAQPELVNQDPYGAGWLFRLQTDSPLAAASLMSAADYEKYLADEAK